MFEFLRRDDRETGCRCRSTVEDGTLSIDATDCPHGGELESSPACRETAVDSLEGVEVSTLVVENRGVSRDYTAAGLSSLNAAAAFARRVESRDPRLAALARREPIRAATEAAGRAGVVGDLVETTGLDGFLPGSDDRDGPRDPGVEPDRYLGHLRPLTAPTIASARLQRSPPAGCELRERYVTDSGATVRIYDPADGPGTYHLQPVEFSLDPGTFARLAAARRRLVDPEQAGTSLPSVHEAVAAVAQPDDPVDTLAQILEKHTCGYGVLDDLFADPAVSEVFVNAPTGPTGLHVRTDGEALRTNVQLSTRGREQVASRIRTESGRAFSRASPTVDALLSNVGSRSAVRVAGLRPPASDGLAFAFRAEGTETWRLERLVRLGTLSPAAAGLLSVAVRRGAAVLVAGPRGAGKTTMLSALLWELNPSTRLLAIEDTPELPVAGLQAAGRDAQRIRASTDSAGELDPAAALHTALRLGDSALVLGEVRGSEASVLYEAMRVGAASDAVLGTIHGEGYDGVRERVVSDLGVPATSFAITDLLVTLAPVNGSRRVVSVEEVTGDGAGTLFERTGDGLVPGPRLARGNSEAVASLGPPGETYAETRAAIRSRSDVMAASPDLRSPSVTGQSGSVSATQDVTGSR